MFCPQCRHIWTVEANGHAPAKRVAVRGKRCPTCGVLLTRDRMAQEFPVDEYAYRGTAAITVSEVIRQSLDRSSQSSSRNGVGLGAGLDFFDRSPFHSNESLRRRIPRQTDRLSLMVILISVALSLLFFASWAVWAYLAPALAHPAGHSVVHGVAKAAISLPATVASHHGD